MNNLKNAFLDRYNPERDVEVAISMAISASVQHNSLYHTDTTANQRAEVRRVWSEFLTQKQKQYLKRQTVSVYEQDIEDLKRLMNDKFNIHFRSTPHPKYKAEPGFRISHAQKSLSVFLKHLWSMGLIETPPQCPVDKIILERAGRSYPQTKWGYVNSIEEHREKIQMLVEAKGEGKSLAEWELEQFKPVTTLTAQKVVSRTAERSVNHIHNEHGNRPIYLSESDKNGKKHKHALRITSACNSRNNLGAICWKHSCLDLQNSKCQGRRYLIGEIAAKGGNFLKEKNLRRSVNGETCCWSGSSYEAGVRFESIEEAVRYLMKYFDVRVCESNDTYTQEWINAH